MNRQQWASLGLGALAGAAVGGIMTLLYAPKSGKELRQQIKGKTSEVVESSKNKVGDFRHLIGEKISGEQCVKSGATSSDGN